MITVRKAEAARRIVKDVHRSGKTIGFVPTMGALHSGHLSLIRRARKETDFVAVSIFVNPTQFVPGEDFERYPRRFTRDKRLLQKEGVDLLFAPDVHQMYPKGFSTYVVEENLTKVLCGRRRPGHFRGVTTIVAKLLNLLNPDRAYFGQKDYQQSVVIERMVKDLNIDTKVVVSPAVRERGGLAVSSRNDYLSQEERKKALCLYEALKVARALAKRGERDCQKIVKAMKRRILQEKGVRIDYVSIVHSETLKELSTLEGKAVAAVAVWVGKARLIDNAALYPKVAYDPIKVPRERRSRRKNLDLCSRKR